MAEYVEREDIFNKKVEVPLFGKMVEMVAVSEIQRIPAADVRPVVRGRWVDVEDSMLSTCTVCGFDVGAYTFRYCPNCGADMREAKT